MTGSAARPVSRGVARTIVAVAAPGLVVAVAWLLWWISNERGHVGPLDRAAFGWLVVVPVWLTAPAVAGLVWGRLDKGSAVAAALVVGTIVALATAILFWQAAAHPACARPVRAPVDWIVPSIITGVFVGAGLTLSGLAAAGPFREDRRPAGLIAGVGLEVAMAVLTIFAVGVLFLAGPGCQPS